MSSTIDPLAGVERLSVTDVARLIVAQQRPEKGRKGYQHREQRRNERARSMARRDARGAR